MNDEPHTEVSDDKARPRFRPCPWIEPRSVEEVEAWIELHNRSMQEHIGAHETGYGLCFTLAEGGKIFMQTSQDGSVILDVDGDAQWVAPLISAVSGIPAPVGALWILPDDKLIELIFGLSSLIASTILVVGHHFGQRQRRR